MGFLNRTAAVLLAATALTAGVHGHAQAAFTLTVGPDGAGNVLGIGSGTLNTTALNMQPTGGPFTGALAPSSLFNAPVAQAGATVSTALQSAVGVSGPSSFGPGFGTGANPVGITLATSGTGDIVGIALGLLTVPSGYVSGSPLSSLSLWAGQSIASMGMTPGTYNFTWGSGPSADAFTLVVTTTPIPEPGTAVLLAVGGALLLLLRRKRAGQAR